MEPVHSQPQEPPGQKQRSDPTRIFVWGAFLVIVVVLVTIAIPNFIAYRQRGYGAAANADVKNGYTSSQAYFSDYPDGQVSLASLTTYGYTQTANVTVAILGGTMSTLTITSHHHESTTTYTVDSTGKITQGVLPWWRSWLGLGKARP